MPRTAPSELIGSVVKCVSPTPGLIMGAPYEVDSIVDDIIVGPLLVIRDMVTLRLLSDAYYPWRFIWLRSA